MSDDSPLSPTLRALCEAAGRLLTRFPEGPEREQTSGGSVAAPADLLEATGDHAERYVDLLRQIEDEITRLDYLVGGEAAAAEIFSSVGRIELILKHTRRNLDEVLAWRDDPKVKLGGELLAGMHRHLFDQIRGMTREMAEDLREPVAALERRGLPTTGKVTLHCEFEFTDPPQLAALEAWAERQKRRETWLERQERRQEAWLERQERRQEGWGGSDGAWGCLGAVLLAAVLFWLLGG